MQNFEDRARLRDAEEAHFVERCQDEFIEKSLAATNARKVKTLTSISFLPNVVSAVTSGFFVVFLLSGYPRTIAIVLGSLLLAVVAAVEIGKRALITGIAKEYFVIGRVAGIGVIALVVLIGVSMVASYKGGSQLITETATEPAKEVNPEIATLSAQLADQRETIQRLQKTTWKGKITVDASKGIVQAKKIESSLVERLTALQAADDAAHGERLAKQTGQRLNFGYLLGVLAAIADLFLLGLIFTAKRLKYEVAAINYRPTPAMSGGVQYITGAASIPAAVPPPSQNATQPPPPRRQIGFSTDDALRYAMRNATVTGTEKACENCGQIFTARTTWHKYCTEECKIAAWETRTGKKFHKAKQP